MAAVVSQAGEGHLSSDLAGRTGRQPDKAEGPALGHPRVQGASRDQQHRGKDKAGETESQRL